MRRYLVLALLALFVAVTAAACGDDGESESEAEREREESRAGVTCQQAPAALTGSTGLPGAFPKPDDVTYTATRAAGPSTIVEGYAEAELADVYDGYRDALGDDPYSVTKSEKEEHDAEVNFAGAQTTGQVRLGEECKGRTSVRITARPE